MKIYLHFIKRIQHPFINLLIMCGFYFIGNFDKFINGSLFKRQLNAMSFQEGI